jgi:hypothetical protein
MRVKTMKLKTLKRNDFHILYEAQHPETGERFIVFRSLDEEEKVWVLPKEEFLQDSIKLIKHKSQQDRLAQNSEDVFFPNISYSDKIPPLVDDDVFSTSVKSMITLLVRKGLVTKGVFAELRTDDDIEALILEKIKNYSYGDNIEEIFHLIQIWGGIIRRSQTRIVKRHAFGDIICCGRPGLARTGALFSSRAGTPLGYRHGRAKGPLLALRRCSAYRAAVLPLVATAANGYVR